MVVDDDGPLSLDLVQELGSLFGPVVFVQGSNGLAIAVSFELVICSELGLDFGVVVDLVVI